MAIRKIFRNYLPIVIFIAGLLVSASWVLLRPCYEWDSIAYIGCSAAIDGESAKTAHDTAYAMAKAQLDTAAYSYLTTGLHAEFREAARDSVPVFTGQLGFYYVKPIYLAVTYAMYKLPFPYYRSHIILNIICFIALIIMTLLMMRGFAKEKYIWVLSLITAWMPGTFSTMSLLYPDAFTACCFLIMFLFYFRDYKKLFYISLFFNVLVRTDNIIICGGLLLFDFIFAEKSSKPTLKSYVLLGLGLFVLYEAVNAVVRPYSWAILFENSFVYPILDMVGHEGKVSLVQYLTVLTRTMANLSRPEHAIALFMTVTLFVFRKFVPDKLPLRIIIFLWIIIAFRVLLYPQLALRYYFQFFVVMGVMYVRALYSLFKGLVPTEEAYVIDGSNPAGFVSTIRTFLKILQNARNN